MQYKIRQSAPCVIDSCMDYYGTHYFLIYTDVYVYIVVEVDNEEVSKISPYFFDIEKAKELFNKCSPIFANFPEYEYDADYIKEVANILNLKSCQV